MLHNISTIFFVIGFFVSTGFLGRFVEMVINACMRTVNPNKGMVTVLGVIQAIVWSLYYILHHNGY